MRKTFFFIAIGLIATLLFVSTAFAIAPPDLDPVKSPFSGTKQVITGTTAPGASVTVTGGPYQIPPTVADASGNFSVTLSLTRNNTNIFQVWVSKAGEVSDQVQITIVESETQAAAAEVATGQDYSAPDAPVVDPVTGTVDALYYTITGTAEPSTRIFITGEDAVEAATTTTGSFAAQVMLTQNKKNKFYLEAKDAAGNVSPKTFIEITEQGEVEEVEEIVDEVEELEIAAPFSDITGHPKAIYIDTLRLRGILQGYPDGTVRPDAHVNRAELLKMAMLSFDIDVLSEATESPFVDVPRLTWFARFVETGKNEGVISGYPDYTFRPAQTVNKAEALKIILESSGETYDPAPPATYLFPDVTAVNVSDWYYKYVYFMKMNDILSLTNDEALHPDSLMTRGDLAEIIVRLQDFQNN